MVLFIRVCLIGLLLFLTLSEYAPTLASSPTPNPPAISAQTAALIDVQSGRILATKNGDKRMRIASLTKIMTAIVAIEAGNIQDIVTVSDRAYAKEGSSIYLKRGEKMKLEDLLYGLMMRSGNDAAVAIAEHVGGTVEGFSRLMNEKAEYIGMEKSHFMNPHGLDDSNEHYSTANDMVKLTAYALRNPVFQRIVSTQVKTIPWEGESWGRKLVNKNKMLRLYEGADGVKTGYTKLAHRCLSSAATRNGQQLAILVLDAPQDWEDSMRWMDYGFSHYPLTPIVNKEQRITEEKTDKGTVAYYSTRSFAYPLARNEKETVSKRVTIYQEQPVVEVYVGEKIVGRIVLRRIQETWMQSIVHKTEENWQLFWSILLGGD